MRHLHSICGLLLLVGACSYPASVTVLEMRPPSTDPVDIYVHPTFAEAWIMDRFDQQCPLERALDVDGNPLGVIEVDGGQTVNGWCDALEEAEYLAQQMGGNRVLMVRSTNLYSTRYTATVYYTADEDG